MATKTQAQKNGAPEATPVAIQLEPLAWQTMEVPIVGESPLLSHKFSEKARKLMLDKQQGKARAKKAPKNPERDAHEATYWVDEAETLPGHPAAAFKGAIADAARYFQGLTMEDLKRIIRVEGEGKEQLVPIEAEMTFTEMPVRIAGQTGDLRHRNMLWPWSATLKVKYLSSMITAESVVALVDAAGANGVGDWRPSSPRSRTGTYGTFSVLYESLDGIER